MTNVSSPSNTSPWPTWTLWPFELLDRPAPASSVSVDQPINPGWTSGNVYLTEQNSTAPDTERDIVAVESYGRQLGRVIDALAALINERPNSMPQSTALNELTTLHDKIEGIKLQSAARRLDRIAADLSALKNSNDPEYLRLAEKLREALADQD